MFFVLCRNKVTKVTTYITNTPVKDELKQAIDLLENCATNFIEEEHGSKRAKEAFKNKNVDINTLEDGYYLVKEDNNPFRINVYLKKTEVLSGYVYNSAQVTSKLVRYFYLLDAGNCVNFTICSKCDKPVVQDRTLTQHLYLVAKDTNYSAWLDEMINSDIFKKRKLELNNEPKVITDSFDKLSIDNSIDNEPQKTFAEQLMDSINKVKENLETDSDTDSDTSYDESYDSDSE